MKQRIITTLAVLLAVQTLGATPGNSFIYFTTNCENPDDVASIVFERYSPDIFARRNHTTYQRIAFPDGRTLHRFDPPGGNGSYAYQPSFFFSETNNTLNLVFSSEGRSTELAEFTLNKQPVFITTWREFSTNDHSSVYKESAHFWHLTNTIPAYTITDTYQHSDGTRSTHTNWIHQSEYLSARMSWTYTVQSGDTLSHIAQRFTTPIATILAQNHLANANRLQAGLLLRVRNTSP